MKKVKQILIVFFFFAMALAGAAAQGCLPQQPPAVRNLQIRDFIRWLMIHEDARGVGSGGRRQTVMPVDTECGSAMKDM